MRGLALGLRFLLLASLVLAGVSSLAQGGQPCKTTVTIFYDVSGSTESREPVSHLLEVIRDSRVRHEVDIWPFGASIGQPGPCHLDLSDGLLGQIDACTEGAASYRSLRGTTNITLLINTLVLQLKQRQAQDDRWVAVILSDFEHDAGASAEANLAEWRFFYRARIKPLVDLLEFNTAHELLLVELERTPNSNGAPILKDLAAVLREFFKTSRYQNRSAFEDMIFQSAIHDPRQLIIEGIKIQPDGLNFVVRNPACEARTIDHCTILFKQPQHGSLELANCQRSIDAGGRQAYEKLAWVGDPPTQCVESVLRVAESASASADSRAFTFGECFRFRRIDFDVSKNVDGAATFAECNKLRQANSDWEDWKKADIENPALSPDEGRDAVQFFACIQASGSDLEPVGGKYQILSIRKGDKNLRKLKIPMERFTLDAEPDTNRTIPLHFTLSREAAYDLCYQPHQEVAVGLGLVADREFSGWSADIDKMTLLSRDRNSKVEEQLHDLWESSSIPILGLLALVGLAMWGARNYSTDAAEGLIGLIGVCVFGLAAAMHDATNLGDLVEKWYVDWPWFTCTVLILMTGAMIWYICLGTIEARQSKASSSFEFGLNRLSKRRASFWRRVSTWCGLTLILCLLGLVALRTYPKDIEECHYYGTAQIVKP